MGNYKLFNNRFVSVRSLCNQSNVQLNFVRLAKWEICFGEFCYIQMAFVRWTGIPNIHPSSMPRTFLNELDKQQILQLRGKKSTD